MEPPKQDALPISGRAKTMKKYVAKRRDEGFVQIKMWVPAEVADWLLDFAESARSAARLGVDISHDLPKDMVGKIIIDARKGK